jgi:phage baseplate assembly protein W
MPLERVSIGFKDISLSLKYNPLTKDLITIKNETAISRSLQNLVRTISGERFFQPYVGSKVTALLFENVNDNTASSIKSEIELTIQNNEPRVELIEVVVDPDYDEGIFNVTIKYLIVGIDALPQQLSFALQPTR